MGFIQDFFCVTSKRVPVRHPLFGIAAELNSARKNLVYPKTKTDLKMPNRQCPPDLRNPTVETLRETMEAG
jgi:hypothetical protein